MTCSCRVRSARPSATMPSASLETTSALTGPDTRSQIRRMMSPGSPSSLARRLGLVVAPDRTPHAAISSTSATDPVSMKSLMCPTIPRRPAGSTSAARRTRRTPASGPGRRARGARARKSTVSATSWTRTIAAPASTPKPTAASVPPSRSAGSRPVIAPTKYLRETASSTGRRSTCEALERPQHLDRLGRRLGEVGAGVEHELLVARRRAARPAPCARPGSAGRRRRRRRRSRGSRPAWARRACASRRGRRRSRAHRSRESPGRAGR